MVGVPAWLGFQLSLTIAKDERAAAVRVVLIVIRDHHLYMLALPNLFSCRFLLKLFLWNFQSFVMRSYMADVLYIIIACSC